MKIQKKVLSKIYGWGGGRVLFQFVLMKIPKRFSKQNYYFVNYRGN
jgi:hypothetical protein